MSSVIAFTPILNASAVVSATSTSSSASVTTNGSSFLITNLGPNAASVRWGAGAQTATVLDMPILPGTQVIVSKSFSTDTVAAICQATQTAGLVFTPGEGQ